MIAFYSNRVTIKLMYYYLHLEMFSCFLVLLIFLLKLGQNENIMNLSAHAKFIF